MDFEFLQEFGKPRSVKLKTHIADAIRHGIIKGKLKPGQQLHQDKIAAAMGASSIPVREALSALREERLVTYYPNRGTFVSEIDAEKVREAFEIRFFLESGALSLSLPIIRDEDFQEADRFFRLEATETDAGKKTEYDLAFHLALCKPSGRPHLLQLIEQMHRHVARFVNMTVYLMNFKRHPEFNHERLFTACRARDVDESVLILKNHLQVASDIICKNIEP
jgi:DNA-binding GntR family transcriptional regulator